MYEGYVHAALTKGATERYSALFPDVEGAGDIAMYSHRAGVTSLYLFDNTGDSSVLNESISMFLVNQRAVICDEIDEESIGGAVESYAPKCQVTVDFKFQLLPGQRKLLIHRCISFTHLFVLHSQDYVLVRPLTADGAESRMSRSCNLSSSISDAKFIELCKTKGQVNCLSIDLLVDY